MGSTKFGVLGRRRGKDLWANASTWRTFDIEAPELEAYLRENVGTYGQRQCTGVELPLETVPRGGTEP